MSQTDFLWRIYRTDKDAYGEWQENASDEAGESSNKTSEGKAKQELEHIIVSMLFLILSIWLCLQQLAGLLHLFNNGNESVSLTSNVNTLYQDTITRCMPQYITRQQVNIVLWNDDVGAEAEEETRALK